MAEQVTLTLPDALAKRVRDVAASTQRDLEEVLLEWIDHTSLQLSPPNADAIAPAEAQLRQQINLGFSSDWWGRYQVMKGDRQSDFSQ